MTWITSWNVYWRNAGTLGNAVLETLSTGERLIVALVLNRADWLQQLGYTMVEAIDWIGDEWVQPLRQAQRMLNEE